MQIKEYKTLIWNCPAADRGAIVVYALMGRISGILTNDLYGHIDWRTGCFKHIYISWIKAPLGCPLPHCHRLPCVFVLVRVMIFWTEAQSWSTRVRCRGSISRMAGVSRGSSFCLIISWSCAKRYMIFTKYIVFLKKGFEMVSRRIKMWALIVKMFLNS